MLEDSDSDVLIAAVSYRGYWKSRGKPSQYGIELDALAALRYMQQIYPGCRIILWGQSIGAGVATTLLARHMQDIAADASLSTRREPEIAGLILETPFVSVKSMLISLYPQKWLPYRYLHPFLRSHWDSGAALRSIYATENGKKVPTMLVVAGKDELVPPEHGDQLASVCKENGMTVRTRVIPGALHVDAMGKPDGRRAVAEFVRDVLKATTSQTETNRGE